MASIKQIYIDGVDSQPCTYCKMAAPNTCQNCKDEEEAFLSNLDMEKEREKAKKQLATMITDYVFVFEPTKYLQTSKDISLSDGEETVSLIENFRYVYSELAKKKDREILTFITTKKGDESKPNVDEIDFDELENKLTDGYQKVPLVKVISDLFNAMNEKNKEKCKGKIEESQRRKGRFLRIILVLECMDDYLEDDNKEGNPKFNYRKYKKAVDLFKSCNRNYEAIVSNFIFVDKAKVIEGSESVKFKRSDYYSQLTDVPLENDYISPVNELNYILRLLDYSKNELEDVSKEFYQNALDQVISEDFFKAYIQSFDNSYEDVKRFFRALVKDIHFYQYCGDYALSEDMKRKIYQYMPDKAVPREVYEEVLKFFQKPAYERALGSINTQKESIQKYLELIQKYQKNIFGIIDRNNSEYWTQKFVFLQSQLTEWNAFLNKVKYLYPLVERAINLMSEYAGEVEKY
ncbi:MAG: hypothetical protein MJ252_11945 [archaeon]|nr:hypothetical protein [archaeon]